MLMYRITMPTLMNAEKDDRIIMPKEGALHRSRGMMGSFVNFDSQIANATKWSMETMRSAYSYGSFQPTTGAWLLKSLSSRMSMVLSRKEQSIVCMVYLLPDEIE